MSPHLLRGFWNVEDDKDPWLEKAYFGYRLKVNVMNDRLIERMTNKLRDMFMDWKSQSWSFHVHLKVVPCIWEPMTSYHLLLLLCFETSTTFVVDKEG